MKSTIRRSTLFLFLILSITAIKCKKDKNTLPPETQVGNNKFGCLVNGQVFKPKGGGIRSNRDCYYQQIYIGSNGFVFHVAGADLSNTTTVYDVNINCDSVKIIENQVYILKNTSKGNSVGAYFKLSNGVLNEYVTTNYCLGELVIKKFDEVNHIAAGTFWFNAVNSSKDTIRVTNGRFDMKYTQ